MGIWPRLEETVVKIVRGSGETLEIFLGISPCLMDT